MDWIAVATYRQQGLLKPGLVVNEQVFDLKDISQACGVTLPDEWLNAGGVQHIFSKWEANRKLLKELAKVANDCVRKGQVKPVDGKIEIAAPYVPERIFCAASNYAEHAEEMGTELAAKKDSKPYMFLKLANTVIGDGDDILMPPETQMLDWEVELAVVIGKPCRRVSVENALDMIAGYTVINDVSARDLNVRKDYPFKHDWFQGKCHDTFAPLGPWIVPAWQVSDPQSMGLRLTVNGEAMQDGTTEHMIWTVREQIAYLSTIVTLQPGDVIATGTPTGVGMGRGVYLKAGDVVAAEVKGIGRIENRVKAEIL